MAKKKNYTRTQYVSFGECTLVGGKKGIVLRELIDDDTLGEEVYFSKGRKKYYLGTIYSFPALKTEDEGLVLKFGQCQTVGLLDNPKFEHLLNERRLEEQSVLRDRRRAAASRKFAKIDLPDSFKELCRFRSKLRNYDAKRELDAIVLKRLRTEGQ